MRIYRFVARISETIAGISCSSFFFLIAHIIVITRFFFIRRKRRIVANHVTNVDLAVAHCAHIVNPPGFGVTRGSCPKCGCPWVYCNTCDAIRFTCSCEPTYCICAPPAALTNHVTRVKRVNTHVIMIVMFAMMIPCVMCAPKTRRGAGAGSGGSSSGGGGAPRPSVMDFIPKSQYEWDKLPGVQRWNGLPFHDFPIWLLALTAALGAIVQEGVTLLETATGDDADPTAAGDADAIRKYKTRVKRLYACLMNYLSPTSLLARRAEREFPNEGVYLFNQIKLTGKKKLSDDKRQKYLHAWSDATMANAGIKFDTNALLNWYNFLDRMRWKFPDEASGEPGKNNNQLRQKFFQGLPRSFDYVVTSERMIDGRGSLGHHGANYEAGHPQAGTARPPYEANKANMDAIIAAYQPEWDRAIDVGRIKIVPKGSVYSTILDDDDSHDDGADSPTECASVVADTDVSDDVADDEGHAPHDGLESAQAVSSSNVKWYMICLVCGGMGHGSVVDGTPCLTKKLGNSISKSTLQKIKYPHGLSPPSLAKSTGEKSERGRPKFKGKFDKHAKSRSQSPRFREASEDESDHASRAFDKTRKGKFSRKPNAKSKSKHVRMADEVEETDDDGDTEVDSDDDKSEEQVNQLAHAYESVDIRTKAYESYDESSDSDEQVKVHTKGKKPILKSRKSPTTKGNKI